MVVTNGVEKDGEPHVEAPASNHILPGSHFLPTVEFPKSWTPAVDDPEKIALDWVKSFNGLLDSAREGSDFSDVFLEKSYWRDLLCLTWDFHTLQSREEIVEFADGFIHSARSMSLSLDTSLEHRKPVLTPLASDGSVNCVRAFLNIETDVGRGRGVVKLTPDATEGQKWKAFTLLPALEELKGHEELTKWGRPAGVKDGQDHGTANWNDKRTAEQNFDDGREPVVLIIGGLCKQGKCFGELTPRS